MSTKEQTRQKLLWYTFYFIVGVTSLAFISSWMNKDISNIENVVGTAIGALSLLGVGNLATNPGSTK